MPVALSDIIAQKRWLQVDIDELAINVAYAPNKITLRRAEELQRLLDRLETDKDISYAEEMARMFADLVSDWDIVGDDGKPYPITVDALIDFPSAILTTISQTIQQDIQAGNEEKKASSATSGATSSPTGSLAPVRTGTR